MIIYLDESGDLGWKFTAPYRKGGSSRFLTIASLVVSADKKHLPKRIVRKMYKKFKWPTSTEKKWSEMNNKERVFFAEQAQRLISSHLSDVKYLSITVKKENVQEHIRSDSNKLYNYMIGLSLVNEMSKHKNVTFMPDPRSIKVESGNSLHDYLQTQLWFEKQVPTILNTIPCDSSASLNIQFSDMISGIIQGHFEDGNSELWNILKDHIDFKTLFF